MCEPTCYQSVYQFTVELVSGIRDWVGKESAPHQFFQPGDHCVEPPPQTSVREVRKTLTGIMCVMKHGICPVFEDKSEVLLNEGYICVKAVSGDELSFFSQKCCSLNNK